MFVVGPRTPQPKEDGQHNIGWQHSHQQVGYALQSAPLLAPQPSPRAAKDLIHYSGSPSLGHSLMQREERVQLRVTHKDGCVSLAIVKAEVSP